MICICQSRVDFIHHCVIKVFQATNCRSFAYYQYDIGYWQYFIEYCQCDIAYWILDISLHSARCILRIANHGQTSGTAIKVSRATNWSSGNMCTKPRCKFWMLWTKWESGSCGQISTSINHLHSDLQTLFVGRRCGWRWNLVHCSPTYFL